MVVLGGLDSERPPLATFSRGGGDPSGMTMGDYRGSALSLNLQIDPATVPLRITLPGEGPTGVLYMPVADMSDLSGTLTMSTGSVNVEEAVAEAGEIRLRGTFSGTLEARGGGEPLELSDGRFDVRGVPLSTSVQPTGG